MSFAGFVFDMIRRDKENRNLRLLRRERLNERLDKNAQRVRHAPQHNRRRHGENNQTYPAKGMFRTETYCTHDADCYGSLHCYCICIGFHIYPLIQSIHGNYRHIIPQPGHRTALVVNPIILYMEIQDRPATCNPYRYGTHDCAAFLHRHLSEIPFSLE